MKAKIFSAIALFLFILKVQAQITSVNEAKSTLFVSDSFEKEYQKGIIDKEIKQLEIKKSSLSKKADSVSKKNIESLDKKISSLISKKNKVGNSSDEALRYKAYYDRIISDKQDEIDDYNTALEDETLELADIDSIYNLIAIKKHEIELEIVKRDEKTSSLGKFPWLFPSWKKSNRKKFFHDMYSDKTDKTIFLNSFSLNSNSNATAVQTEMVTDNMWAMRLSFGNVLSVSPDQENSDETPEEQKKDETEQEAFSRLINGGGNFYLDLTLPLVTTNQNNGDQITFYGYANLRGAMDVKGFSSNVDTSTGNGTFGLNIYSGISSDNKKFNFFLQANANYTVGTDIYYKNLGLYNEKPFVNGKIITGVTILNQFRFSAMVTAFGSDEKIRSNKVIVGIQILPGL